MTVEDLGDHWARLIIPFGETRTAQLIAMLHEAAYPEYIHLGDQNDADLEEAINRRAGEVMAVFRKEAEAMIRAACPAPGESESEGPRPV